MTARRAFIVLLGFSVLFALLPGITAAFFGWGALNMAVGIGIGSILASGKLK